MKKLIFIFIASICLIENSNALTTDDTITIFCPKAARDQVCDYDYKTPDKTCSDSECEKCKDDTSVDKITGVKQILKKIFYENCPDQNGKYTCYCKTTSTTYKCAPGFYGTATSASTGCTKCPDNALCIGGNNSTFDCVSGYIKYETTCVKKDLTCSNTQFIYDGKCYDCPNTGGCDGVTLTCNDDLIQEGPNCICKKGNQNGYINSTLDCITCPEHATCDGLEFTCNKTFTPTPNACICRPGLGLGFINNNQCNKCPANASCDGGDKFSCNRSFYKTNNTCTQCPHNGTTEDGKSAEKLSDCYLPIRQAEYENDAGYFEITDDTANKCYATNK